MFKFVYQNFFLVVWVCYSLSSILERLKNKNKNKLLVVIDHRYKGQILAPPKQWQFRGPVTAVEPLIATIFIRRYVVAVQ